MGSGSGADPRDRWLVSLRREGNYRIVAFSHAGGGVFTFRPWADSLPTGVALYALQLPGRDARVQEPPMQSIEDLVRLALPSLFRLMRDAVPTAFFGYSMGALLAYEMALALAPLGCAPDHLFACAAAAPHRRDERPRRSTLSDLELKNELERMGGTPEEILADPELLVLIAPRLRADFAACETYRHRPGRMLACGMTILGGREDPEIDEEQFRSWGQLTTGPVSMELFPQGHFFMDQQHPRLMSLIADVAQRARKRAFVDRVRDR